MCAATVILVDGAGAGLTTKRFHNKYTLHILPSVCFSFCPWLNLEITPNENVVVISFVSPFSAVLVRSVTFYMAAVASANLFRFIYTYVCSRFMLDDATPPSCPNAKHSNLIQSHQSKQTHSKHLHKTIYGFFNCGLFQQQRTRHSRIFDIVTLPLCVCVWLSFTLSPRTSASCCNGKQNFHREFVYFFAVVPEHSEHIHVPQAEITKTTLHRTWFYDEKRLPKWQQFLRFSPVQRLKWYFYIYFFVHRFLIVFRRRQLGGHRMRAKCTSLSWLPRWKKTLQENTISWALIFIVPILSTIVFCSSDGCIGASSEQLPSVSDCAHRQIASMTPIPIAIIVVIHLTTAVVADVIAAAA